VNGLVLKHTEIVAAQLLERFSHDPEGEIEVWVAIAQRREAMVVRLYADGALERRLPERDPESEPVLAVARKAVAGIWAQESSHTALMSALRSVDGVRAGAIQSLMGSVEGLMTQFATEQGLASPLARWLIGLARSTGAAPEFTRYLGELGLGEFLRFAMELEDTARRGYRRILELIDEIDVKTPSLKYGPTQRYEFAKTGAEERFHFAVFERLLTWLEPGEAGFAPRDPASAVLELRALAQSTLALHMVAGVPEEIIGTSRVRGAGGEGATDELVSDGGLGSLFREFSLDVRVVKPIFLETSANAHA
jgi:hypothetical protein